VGNETTSLHENGTTNVGNDATSLSKNGTTTNVGNET